MAMELLLVLSPLIMALIIFWSFKKKGSKSVKLPPGKMGWPLIGQTLPFMQTHSSASLGRFVDQSIAKYGRIFKMSLLMKPTIVSADADFNRYILQNEGRLFETSCPTSVSEILGRWSVVVLVGDIHHEMRSIALSFTSHAKLRTYFLPDIDQQAAKVLASWKDSSAPFSAQEQCREFAFNLLLKHLMSMDPGMPEMKKLRVEYESFLKGMASLPLNLPGTTYRKALQSRSIILKIMEQKLDERIQKASDGCEALEQDDLLASVSKHPHLTKEQILDLLLNILFGAHETTSSAIALAIYFLESCPKAVNQLREEHTKIARQKKEQGETGLNWDDYKKMEFTHCVINEALRLGNIVQMLYRKTIKDVHFKGYDIPSGWQVVPLISAAHLDPSIYDDPQCFNPWRWQTISAATSKNNIVMSFSAGPRMCPGAELAKLEIAVFLHHLVQKYHWELAEHDYPVSFPFLEFPKGLPIKVRRLDESKS